MKTKLSDLASVAEIVGAIAVILSLIYVGIQVNENASAVRSASANDANTAMQNWYLEVGSSQQTSELFYRALMSDEALRNDEEFQFLMMMHGVFLGFQNSYLLAQEGTIDTDLRESLSMSIGGVRSLPGMQRFWRQRKAYLHAGFAEWVEEIFARELEATVDIYQISASVQNVVSADSDASMIVSLTEQWIDVAATGDVDGYFDFVTDDFVWLGDYEGPGFSGRQDVRDFLEPFFETLTFSMENVSSDEIVFAADGRSATHKYTGTAVMVPKEGGQGTTAKRVYFDFWRKGDDGHWRCSRHLYLVVPE